MPTLLGLTGLKDMILKEVEGADFSENLLMASGSQNEALGSSLLLLPQAKGIINAQYTLSVNALDDGKGR